MEDIANLYQSIFNLFLIIGVGYILNKLKASSDDVMDGINKLVFNLFIPLKIMMSFHMVDFNKFIDLNFLIYTLLTLAILLILSHFIAKFTVKDKPSQVLESNAMFMANYIVMGFPILTAFYGEEAIIIGAAISGLAHFFL